MPEDQGTHQGRAPAERIDFEVVKDVWQEVRLADGTLIRMKMVVTDVFRTETGAGEVTYNIKGNFVALPVREIDEPKGKKNG